MSNPAHLEKLDHPFIDLPPAARPTCSPFDLRLMFNTLSPDNHHPFTLLMREISTHHRDIYNQPEKADDTSRLYGLATAAGLSLIATEMARNWGVKDPDGPKRLTHCDSLRCWPAIDNPQPSSVQLWLAHKKPTMMLWAFPLGGGDRLSIHNNGHTVMDEDAHCFKPGDWIGDLLVEYARFRIWREQFGDDGWAAPKPANTLSPTRKSRMGLE